jgi:hypothetical protein
MCSLFIRSCIFTNGYINITFKEQNVVKKLKKILLLKVTIGLNRVYLTIGPTYCFQEYLEKLTTGYGFCSFLLKNLKVYKHEIFFS